MVARSRWAPTPLLVRSTLQRAPPPLARAARVAAARFMVEQTNIVHSGELYKQAVSSSLKNWKWRTITLDADGDRVGQERRDDDGQVGPHDRHRRDDGDGRVDVVHGLPAQDHDARRRSSSTHPPKASAILILRRPSSAITGSPSSRTRWTRRGPQPPPDELLKRGAGDRERNAGLFGGAMRKAGQRRGQPCGGLHGDGASRELVTGARSSPSSQPSRDDRPPVEASPSRPPRRFCSPAAVLPRTGGVLSAKAPGRPEAMGCRRSTSEPRATTQRVVCTEHA